MTVDAVVSMLIVLLLTWGLFGASLAYAMHLEAKKRFQKGDRSRSATRPEDK